MNYNTATFWNLAKDVQRIMRNDPLYAAAVREAVKCEDANAERKPNYTFWLGADA